MSKETVLFKSEERINRADLTLFLRHLADKLEEGHFVLRQGDNEITLSLPQSVVLELKVEDEIKSGGVKHSLEIEIEWRDDDEQPGGVTLG